ncbi:TspO/MBR family protein [Microbacterium sp. JZ31]|uniref:TspO/MBR family protein n=1 Tax=Microbacterium sp. JZ31 TaxID=1906274 RepID=UPI001EE4A554|nr:TspO/MBR family protein [Microbacterium sp. JZ31]
MAAVAAAGSLANAGNVEGWYADAEKAPWNPPGGVFGPVWSVLYAGIAAACFLVWRRGFRGSGQPNAARTWLGVWIVQIALNAMWTPAFFAGFPVLGEAAWWLALAIILLLLVAVIWLAVAAWRWSRIATVVMIAYALWLAFATTLNIAIIALN